MVSQAQEVKSSSSSSLMLIGSDCCLKSLTRSFPKDLGEFGYRLQVQEGFLLSLVLEPHRLWYSCHCFSHYQGG